ncbi:MAG: hypothetical protein ACI4KA_01000 [Oscillospiraceae bacterium]
MAEKWQDAVITNDGISLLGEILGGGEITITRAALGGGTVDPVALMAQTALTSPLDVVPMIAKKTTIEGKGIDIKIQIRNNGVTDTKTMKQVGLFAKVGDGEEVLFAIMQDITGEEIPSEASYAAFMLELTAAIAISNTGNVFVSISGSALVTHEELDDVLKNYATKTDIPTKLPADGGNADTVGEKSSSEFMQNIKTWDSGDFKELVISAAQSGCVFVKEKVTGMPVEGGSYFVLVEKSADNYKITATYNSRVKEEVKTFFMLCDTNATPYVWSEWLDISDGGNADKLDGFHVHEIASNPNLLINPDFAINQRGASDYSGNYAYGVDHWQCQNDGVMTVTNDGIKVGFMSTASSGAKSIIRQHVENSALLCGNTCTLSVDIKELSAVGAQILIMATKSDGSTVYPGSKRITAAGIETLTFVVPDDISALYVWLYGADMRVAGETANSYTVFRWAKLEIGGVATQFTRPDQVVELARCQRYLQKLSAYSVYRAVYVHTNYIDFSIPTPTSMRAGTISITGTPEVMPFPISSPVSGFSFAVQIYGQNQLLLRATKSAHGLTDAVLRVPPGTEILLSAEP